MKTAVKGVIGGLGVFAYLVALILYFDALKAVLS